MGTAVSDERTITAQKEGPWQAAQCAASSARTAV